MKVHISPGSATPSPPSEQLIIPLVGEVSDGQVTNKKYIKTFVLCKQILLHSSLVIYKIRKWYVSNAMKFNQNNSCMLIYEDTPVEVSLY